ncbi:hypothetical protein ACOMHN_040976 [Nucella lapillus]
MATAAAREVPSEDQCSVCNEVFTQPKLLHCGHLLCGNCLLSCLKSEAEASCPLCHNPVVKDSGKTIKEFADGLPTDLAVQTLIESQQALSQDRQCQFCGKQDTLGRNLLHNVEETKSEHNKLTATTTTETGRCSIAH